MPYVCRTAVFCYYYGIHTGKIQNKRSQVDWVGHKANAFLANSVHQFDGDHIEKIRKTVLNITHLCGLDFPDQQLQFNEKIKM